MSDRRDVNAGCPAPRSSNLAVASTGVRFDMSIESLESALQRVGNAVQLLRNSQYPAFGFPVPPSSRTGARNKWRGAPRACCWSNCTTCPICSSRALTPCGSSPSTASNTFANFRPGMANGEACVRRRCANSDADAHRANRSHSRADYVGRVAAGRGGQLPALERESAFSAASQPASVST